MKHSKILFSVLILAFSFLLSGCFSLFSVSIEKEGTSDLAKSTVKESQPVAMAFIVSDILYGQNVIMETKQKIKTQLSWNKDYYYNFSRLTEYCENAMQFVGIEVLRDFYDNFDFVNASHARYQVAARVKDISHYRLDHGLNVAAYGEIKVLWQVYDSFAEEIVYEKEFLGQIRRESVSKKNSSFKYNPMSRQTFILSMRKFLSDDEFLEIIKE